MLTHLHNVHQQAGEHHHGRIDSMQQPSEEVESAMEEAALETSSIADPTSSGLSSMPCDNSASSSLYFSAARLLSDHNVLKSV